MTGRTELGLFIGGGRDRYVGVFAFTRAKVCLR